MTDPYKHFKDRLKACCTFPHWVGRHPDQIDRLLASVKPAIMVAADKVAIFDERRRLVIKDRTLPIVASPTGRLNPAEPEMQTLELVIKNEDTGHPLDLDYQKLEERVMGQLTSTFGGQKTDG